MESSVFGEIAGHPEGAYFRGRAEVHRAGLHRHWQAGISGHPSDGADAIVVSGGYVDDVDRGDWILYTGQGGQEGGRQVRDQELTRGNLALARSDETGLPVRVIRKVGRDEGPVDAAYRYDGLFTVTSHWSAPSVHGPLIWRYVLERADGGDQWEPVHDGAPTGEDVPTKATSVVQRIVRNSAVAQWVKETHEHACQVCGIVLETAVGPYAEGAHIRALGAPHEGSDHVENLLCLCPNHHVLFDKGAIYIDDGEVFATGTGELIGELRSRPEHRIDSEAVRYHRETFAGIR